MTLGLAPVNVVDVELSLPLPHVAARAAHGAHYRSALLVVRLHGEPLGALELPLGGGVWPGPETLARAIMGRFRDGITAHLASDGLDGAPSGDRLPTVPGSCPRAASGAQWPPASVVVATRDRPDAFRRSLRSLLAMDHPRFEVIVVDSAPTSAATRKIVDEHADHSVPVRYVHEAKPGLARARNVGLREAAGRFVGFTDDDVRVDPGWLGALATAFESSRDVTCVTGLALPAELETPAQVWFEQFGGFGRRFERVAFDLHSHRTVEPLYPYRFGWYGSGLNMAFDAAALRDLGGFDTHLGAGTAARGGEDLDAFLRLILSGGRLVYEPRALVWHYHRRELAALRGQIRGSGIGLSAVITKLLVEPSTRRDLLARIRPGFRHLLAPSSPKNQGKGPEFPLSLTLAELTGVAAGPFIYGHARLRARLSHHLA